VFAPDKPSLPTVTFVIKATACEQAHISLVRVRLKPELMKPLLAPPGPSWPPPGPHPPGPSWSLLALDYSGMATLWANTLAYFASPSVTKKKKVLYHWLPEKRI
jgi:hypothetical protein